jgi:Mn-dependent DtxR family transcriptional regulator
MLNFNSKVRKRINLVDELKNEALKILEESDMPLGVGDIAKALDVSWATARAILLTLEAEGKVGCIKTPKSRVYFAKEKESKVK